MNSYKLLFDWQISIPDNWQGEYDKDSGQYIFYPDNSDLTIRITPFHAERDGILAPKEVMEDAYIRTVPASARQRNLDFYIPIGFEAKIYDDVLTEDSNTIYVVYVGYYSAGELLSISVWSTNRDEGERALNVLNTIGKRTKTGCHFSHTEAFGMTTPVIGAIMNFLIFKVFFRKKANWQLIRDDMILDNRYLYDILTEGKYPERIPLDKLLTGAK